MRVLLFRSLCDTGGVSSWMQEHGRELVRAGAEPHFWFCKDSARFPEFHAIGPATIGDMPTLVRAIESNAYDVVHVSSSDAAAEILQSIEPRPKIVASNRGALSRHWNSGDCFARTAVSRAMAEYDQPRTDLLVEPVLNGVDANRFSPPESIGGGSPIVAWVGRTTDLRSKDFPRFTRIASLLAGSGVRLWVADAHGANWSRFESPPCARVDFERWERVAHADMPAFYRAVTESGGVVVMTSTTEGFGWVAVEAAACGAGTIAPAVAGLRETVLDGVTGTLFQPTASDAEVAALVRGWIGNGAAGKAAVARRVEAVRASFSLSGMTSSYLEVYGRPNQLRAPAPRPSPDRDEPTLGVLLGQAAWRRPFQAREILDGLRLLLDAGRTDLASRAFGRLVRRYPGHLLRGESGRRARRVALRLLARRLRGR